MNAQNLDKHKAKDWWGFEGAEGVVCWEEGTV